MNYTKEYFIDKFSKIPEDEWGEIYVDRKAKCALGHCGVTIDRDRQYIHTEESVALIKLFGGKNENEWRNVTRVNDCGKGANPKKRILNKLNSL